MDFTFRFLRPGGYLKAEASGPYSRSQFFTLAEAVAREADAAGQGRVLVDIRQVAGDIPFIDRYDLGVHCAGVLRSLHGLAVVCRAELITGLFENVTVNRGLNASVQADADAALAWLLQFAPGLRSAT